MTKEDRNATGGVKRPQRVSGPLPAVYRIVASGRLDSSWRGRLGEMEISVHESPSGASTLLEGPVRDRAELTGILNTLNDLHLTLLRVEVVDDQPNT